MYVKAITTLPQPRTLKNNTANNGCVTAPGYLVLTIITFSNTNLYGI